MRRFAALTLVGSLSAGIALWLIAVARDRDGDLRPPATPAENVSAPVDEHYATRVQPILDRRCVVCHACFDAPCQLNLQSFAGLDRGANKQAIYHPNRIQALAPTRMFVDANDTETWQTRFGFFPVLARGGLAPSANSTVMRLLEQRRAVPSGGPFDASAPATCPAAGPELEGFLRAHPDFGMPFGFPPLTAAELDTLREWLQRGGYGPPTKSGQSPALRTEIASWESVLNADDPRSKLVARYVYEHLFFAHLQFSANNGEFYRLVRSRSAPPSPIDEIATARPYDDPHAARVYYRFRQVRETIVYKTHVPYRLDAARLERLRAQFFETPWEDPAPRFPSYAPEVAANPFVVFAAIPARARYQFMLDDTFYHVNAFIRGPVCKGQVALDVIDEHFLIFFLDPEADPAVTDPAYLRAAAADLAVPAQGGDGIEAIYLRFKAHELAYVHRQAEYLREVPGKQLGDIWNGGGTESDAVLTVYRHFDNAVVLHGAVGGVPKTAWVLDYPIFERMYYDLVAGFDVFGNLVHQLSTRRYMNLLRIESEDQFLRFLPVAERKRMRDYWYRGAGVATLVDVLDPFYGGAPPRIAFRDPSHAKDELVQRLVREQLGPSVTGALEPIQWKDQAILGEDTRALTELALRSLVATTQPFVRTLPDAMLLRVETDTPQADLIYTLIRNRAHANIDFMFLEGNYLIPNEDTLHAVRGVAVSRPNLFLRVRASDVAGAIERLLALDPGDDSWQKFVRDYGVSRTDARFWEMSDFFNSRFAMLEPLAAGVLDLSRYTND